MLDNNLPTLKKVLLPFAVIFNFFVFVVAIMCIFLVIQMPYKFEDIETPLFFINHAWIALAFLALSILHCVFLFKFFSKKVMAPKKIKLIVVNAIILLLCIVGWFVAESYTAFVNYSIYDYWTDILKSPFDTMFLGYPTIIVAVLSIVCIILIIPIKHTVRKEVYKQQDEQFVYQNELSLSTMEQEGEQKNRHLQNKQDNILHNSQKNPDYNFFNTDNNGVSMQQSHNQNIQRTFSSENHQPIHPNCNDIHNKNNIQKTLTSDNVLRTTILSMLILSIFVAVFILITALVDKIKLNSYLNLVDGDLTTISISQIKKSMSKFYFVPMITMGFLTLVLSGYMIAPLVIKKYNPYTGVVSKAKYINSFVLGIITLTIFVINIYLGLDRDNNGGITGNNLSFTHTDTSNELHYYSFITPLYILQFLFYIVILLAVVVAILSLNTLSSLRKNNIYGSRIANHFGEFAPNHLNSNYPFTNSQNINNSPLKQNQLEPNINVILPDNIGNQSNSIGQEYPKDIEQDPFITKLNRIKQYYEQGLINKEEYDDKLKDIKESILNL